MVNYLKHNLLISHLAYYMTFNVIVWMVHLLLVSTVAFFHFLLDHNLKIIEEWIYDQGWFIIILAKIISFYFILKILSLKSDSKHPWKGYFSWGGIIPSREILVVVIFLVFFIIWLGRPVMTIEVEFNFFRAILSYTGNGIFYFVDFLVFGLLQYFSPLEKREQILSIFLFPLVFLLWQKGIFLYGRGIDFWVYFHFYFCLFLGSFITKCWSLPALYLLMFASPLGAFMGIDAIWKDDFSLLKLSQSIKPSYLVALMLINMIYLKYKKIDITEKY